MNTNNHIFVTINNSMSKIENLPMEEMNKLRKLLSYQIPNQGKYSKYLNHPHYLIDKKGNFPTGLLYLVEQFLIMEYLNTYTIWNDHRVRPKSGNNFTLSLGYTPYPDQVQAAAACADAGRGIIVAPTGTGKSLITALIVHVLQVRTLIVVPSLELKKQLTVSLTDAYGWSLVGGLGSPIAIENVDALDPKEVLNNYDCVIIDEFHHSGAKTYQDLNKIAWSKVFYKFGLTATPFRSQDHEQLLLEGVLSKVIYSIDYKKAVDKNYIVPLEAYYVELPRIRLKGEGRKWAQVYDELIIDREDRNILIVSLARTFCNADRSVLILVKQIRHGKILQEIFKKSGYPVVFANGQDDESNKHIKDFSNGKIGILIASSIVGEGVDTKAAEYVLLAGGVGKSKVTLMQNCGRVFRKSGNKASGKVFAFKDDSHKFFRDHYRHFLKTLAEEYKLVPSKVDFSLYKA